MLLRCETEKCTQITFEFDPISDNIKNTHFSLPMSRWTGRQMDTNHFSGYFRPCETYGGISIEERRGALNTVINSLKKFFKNDSAKFCFADDKSPYLPKKRGEMPVRDPSHDRPPLSRTPAGSAGCQGK